VVVINKSGCLARSKVNFLHTSISYYYVTFSLLLFIFSLQIAGSLEIAGSPSDVAVYSLVALSQCHIIFVFILEFCNINLIR